MSQWQPDFAKACEKKQVRQLMQRVFGDDDVFCHSLFHYFPIPRHLLVIRQDEDIVSMAFVMPAVFHFPGHGDVAATYLYACATAPEFRGQGLMRTLLEKAYNLACQRGEAGIFLLPASPALYLFYENLGFQYFFYHDEYEYLQPVNRHKEEHSRDYSIVPLSGSEYARVRDRWLSERVSVFYPLRHYAFMQAVYASRGDTPFYRVLLKEKEIGIMTMYRRRMSLNVLEWLGHDIDKEQWCAELCRIYQVPGVFVQMPGSQKATALFRQNPAFVLPNKEKGYFAFALD
ncbi:MAG: GNAT family N-acetyltransferase [Bacteroidales bacterium]|jgi:GNAT superfamily N-acetyltransferase|nr:GNAT family N-acetyltransferase [Bacteroidales bacterium]